MSVDGSVCEFVLTSLKTCQPRAFVWCIVLLAGHGERAGWTAHLALGRKCGRVHCLLRNNAQAAHPPSRPPRRGAQDRHCAWDAGAAPPGDGSTRGKRPAEAVQRWNSRGYKCGAGIRHREHQDGCCPSPATGLRHRCGAGCHRLSTDRNRDKNPPASTEWPGGLQLCCSVLRQELKASPTHLSRPIHSRAGLLPRGRSCTSKGMHPEEPTGCSPAWRCPRKERARPKTRSRC